MDKKTVQETNHWRKGYILSVQKVVCAGCLTEQELYTNDRRDAAERLDEYGWKLIGRMWHCPTCAQKLHLGGR